MESSDHSDIVLRGVPFDILGARGGGGMGILSLTWPDFLFLSPLARPVASEVLNFRALNYFPGEGYPRLSNCLPVLRHCITNPLPVFDSLV